MLWVLKELSQWEGSHVKHPKHVLISTKAYVVYTQKNRLNETVLLSTQNKR